MYTKGEHGLFTGSTSEGREKAKIASVHAAASKEAGKLKAKSSNPVRSSVGKTEYRAVKLRGTMTLEVAVNPTQDDLNRMLHEDRGVIRVMRDDKGNVYAWDADAALHAEVAEAVGGSKAVLDAEYGEGVPRNSTAPIDLIEMVGRKPQGTFRTLKSWVEESNAARAGHPHLYVKQGRELRRKASGG